jgi:hypothetical protein
MAYKLLTSQVENHIGPVVFDRVRVALESRRDPDDPDAESYRYAISIESATWPRNRRRFTARFRGAT